MRDEQNPKLLNDQGEQYLTGSQGKPKNIEIAFSYFKKAADLQNPIGYYNLARYYREAKDSKQAVAALQKSLAMGYAKAAILLSSMALLGEGQRKSPKNAYKYLLEAVQQNELEAINLIATYLWKGIGTKKDSKTAISYVQRSADMGDPQGMYLLATYLMEDKKDKKAPETAMMWLDQAAQKLHQDAIKTIRQVYLDNLPVVQKKSRQHRDEMIFYYRELLAKSGDLESIREVAQAYYDGTKVVGKNPEKAAEYYQVLLRHRDAEGYYGVGICLLYGRGMSQNIEKAKEHLTTAATMQHPNALVKLGDIARSDALGKPDYEQAKTYYMEAAKQQDPEALLNLGLLHYRRQIAQSTPELAFQYMDQAAKKQSSMADYWLGIFYDRGIGTPKNSLLSEKAFLRAIDQGNSGAKFKYAQVLIEEARSLKKISKKHETRLSQAYNLLKDYLDDSEASKINQLSAMWYFAEAYWDGFGCRTNLRAARYWTEKAADGGLTIAKTKLYQVLRDQEPSNALQWLQQAVQAGDDPQAQYEMGILLLEGYSDVHPDPKAARHMFELAASKKHAKALEKLTML